MHANGKSQLVEVLGKHMLQPNEETLGILVGIHELDSHVFEAQIEGDGWGRAILLPVSLRSELQVIKGKTVGILRLGGEYYVRKVVGG